MSQTRVTVEKARDLLAAALFPIGYIPDNDIILLPFDERQQLICTMRFDMPGPEHSEVDLFDMITRSLDVAGPTYHLGLVVATDDADRARKVYELVRDLMLLSGVGVVLALHICGDRVMTLDCSDPTCCSPDGFPLDAYKDSPIAATFAVELGFRVLPKRTDLGAFLEMAPEESWVSMAGQQVLQDPKALLEAWIDDVAQGRKQPSLPAESLMCLFTNLAFRDSLVPLAFSDDAARLVLDAGEFKPSTSVDWERVDRLLTLLTWLATHAHPAYRVNPLALVAWILWMIGSRPIEARMAVNAALELDPRHRLALLVQIGLDTGARSPWRG